jgi:hypothetical protein
MSSHVISLPPYYEGRFDMVEQLKNNPQKKKVDKPRKNSKLGTHMYAIDAKPVN